MSQTPAAIAVDRLMRAIEEEVRQERRTQLVARGGPTEYRDPVVFAEVEQALRRAIARRDADVLLLPDLLADDRDWRAETDVRPTSHRPFLGPFIVFAKRWLILPFVRWLHEYNVENVRRQEQVNRLLFACIEELAIESAALRQQLGAPDSGDLGSGTAAR